MNVLMKKVAPLFFALLVLVPLTSAANEKDDITGHHHEEALRQIIKLDIMKGYGNGSYKPDGHVTRGQFAAIITRALNLEPPHEGIAFSDVTEETGVMDEVIAAAGAEIITGYPDGSFKPNANISRQHMAVIINRALDYMDMEDKSGALTFMDTPLILKEYHTAISSTVNYGLFKGSAKSDGVYFRPLDNATRGDAAAVTLRFLIAVEKVEIVPPIEGEKPEPPIVDPNLPPVLTFDTAVIQANGSLKVSKKYKTYNEALAALGTDQVITYGNSIIKMPGGIVVTKPTLTSSLTNIYTTKELSAADTYVSADTELEYVGSTDKYVEVKLAGKKGFIKHENSILKPWKAVKERSYYSVSNGTLTHYIYMNSTAKYVSYEVGSAPSFLKAGTKYYSWDGINFFGTNGSKVGTGYQYFQYLPARSTSNYTAKEIDAYIVKMLKKLEADYPNNKTYQNASKRSKLLGLGSYLKTLEKEKKVNALLVLALAQHESAYGLSVRAQEYNNLFGIKVYDDNPEDLYFASVEANIDELMKSYFNKNYIPPNAAYANGAVFGNKGMGFNVKYASDPYWGAKAAGHLYRADKMMGGKDIAKAYKVGLTTAALNVRQQPGTNGQIAYRYNKVGVPVIMIENVTPHPWVKVVSDSIDYNELFVSGDYVVEIPTVR